MVAVLDAAPWDDESSSADEEAVVAKARGEVARGEGIDWGQVKAEAGRSVCAENHQAVKPSICGVGRRKSACGWWVSLGTERKQRRAPARASKAIQD